MSPGMPLRIAIIGAGSIGAGLAPRRRAFSVFRRSIWTHAAAMLVGTYQLASRKRLSHTSSRARRRRVSSVCRLSSTWRFRQRP